MFACVVLASAASDVESRACGIDVAVKRRGGVGPPRVTVERKPLDCRARARDRCRFVEGIEVRPRRAFEAFCRWLQTCARFTRDIFLLLFFLGALRGRVVVGWLA